MILSPSLLAVEPTPVVTILVTCLNLFVNLEVKDDAFYISDIYRLYACRFAL